jgi:hypothetical protein
VKVIDKEKRLVQIFVQSCSKKSALDFILSFVQNRKKWAAKGTGLCFFHGIGIVNAAFLLLPRLTALKKGILTLKIGPTWQPRHGNPAWQLDMGKKVGADNQSTMGVWQRRRQFMKK